MHIRLEWSARSKIASLRSLILDLASKGKQYGILFSLYYLGLKRGQRVNKDGVHLDLGS